jgi:1-phosphofructokinase
LIYTLTLNPSVDYIVELEQVTLGGLNRTTKETKLPGGKGLNVSQVLRNFSVNSKALGFIGGFTGEYIENYLQAKNIDTDFIRVNEDSRINVKLKAEKETEINAKGPSITSAHISSLKKKIGSLTNKDLLVIAGSIPSSMPKDTYEELVKICNENMTPFVVDAEGELLRNVLPHKPLLIKPNHHELGELFNTELHTSEDVIPYAKELISMGAQNIIVSLADKGAVFINKDMSLIASAPKGELQSSVGAGDSMVAGFLTAYFKTHNLEEAFRYSVAAGSATAFSIGLCSRVKVEDLLSQIEIEEKM